MKILKYSMSNQKENSYEIIQNTILLKRIQNFHRCNLKSCEKNRMAIWITKIFSTLALDIILLRITSYLIKILWLLKQTEWEGNVFHSKPPFTDEKLHWRWKKYLKARQWIETTDRKGLLSTCWTLGDNLFIGFYYYCVTPSCRWIMSYGMNGETIVKSALFFATLTANRRECWFFNL